jgi:hypothetical protein
MQTKTPSMLFFAALKLPEKSLHDTCATPIRDQSTSVLQKYLSTHGPLNKLCIKATAIMLIYKTQKHLKHSFIKCLI